MNNNIKIVSSFFLLMLILIFLFSLIPAKGVLIFSYHMISDYQGDGKEFAILPQEFAEQMNYLHKNGYKTILIKDLIEALKDGREIQEKAFVVSFDDGYKDNFSEAEPILRKYGYVATVFIIADYIDKEGFLSKKELLSLKEAGWEIGSHTKTHVMLAGIPIEEAKQEISVSKKIIEEVLNEKVQLLAYPFGSYNGEIEKILKTNAYIGACTGKPGLNNQYTDLYQLKRNSIIRSKFGFWMFRLRIWRALFDEKVSWLLRHIK